MKANASVGVRLPRALEEFRCFPTLVVDDLKTVLQDRGQTLMIHVHPQVRARGPAQLLRRLVAQQRPACWLLLACGHDPQHWFGRNRIPAVVSVACDAALGLPFGCLDNHAWGRHAALTLVQHGPRQVGALLTRSGPALRAGLLDVLAPRREAD